MKIIILVAAVILVVQAAPSTKHDSKQEFKRATLPKLSDVSKIVGGNNAYKGQFPFVAGVDLDGVYFCGGVLIHAQWTMTSAHCIQGHYSFRVHLGALNVMDTTELDQVVLVSDVHYEHPGFNSLTWANDLSLLHLPYAVYNPAIQPISIGYASLSSGWHVIAMGWGVTYDGAPTINPTLKYVDLTVIDNYECSMYLPHITNQLMCARGTPNNNVCNGDHGGPLVVLTSTFPIHYELVGLLSFSDATQTCSSGYPTAYTRVYDYLSWIRYYVPI